MQLGEEERNLAIKLAVATTNCGVSAGRFPTLEDSRFHGYQGPFDQCCKTLWSLDLAVGVFHDGEGNREKRYDQHNWRSDPLPPYFRLASEEEIWDRLADDPRLDDEILKQLIWNFLSLNRDFFDFSPRWFTLKYDFVDILDAFAACGYAEKAGNKYRWSKAMAPHMIDQGVWVEDGQSVDETGVRKD